MDDRRPAEPGDAGPDRVGDALVVLTDGGRIESAATIAHVQHDRVGVDLREDRDLRGTRPLRGVDRRLAGRVEQGPEGIRQRAVADDHDLDGHPVVGLDLALDHLDPLGQGRGVLTDGARRPPVEEPRAQLALLGPREPDHVLRIVGRALDEREGLQHRVVHVGRHLRTLLCERPGLALGEKVTDEPQPPRSEEDDHRGHHQQAPDDRTEQCTGRVAEDHQQDAADPDGEPDQDPGDDRPASTTTVGAHVQHGHQVVADPPPLVLAGVAADEDRPAAARKSGQLIEPRYPM